MSSVLRVESALGEVVLHTVISSGLAIFSSSGVKEGSGKPLLGDAAGCLGTFIVGRVAWNLEVLKFQNIVFVSSVDK